MKVLNSLGLQQGTSSTLLGLRPNPLEPQNGKITKIHFLKRDQKMSRIYSYS